MKAAERLRHYVHPFLRALGATYHGPRGSTSGYDWGFPNTKHGMPLHVTVYDTWVACRFERKARSVTDYDPNPGGYTGKWNFVPGGSPLAMAEDFLTSLVRELPGDRPPLPDIETFVRRAAKIEKGRLWTVFCDGKATHEGSKTACLRHIKATHGMVAHRKGDVCLARVLWENL